MSRLSTKAKSARTDLPAWGPLENVALALKVVVLTVTMPIRYSGEKAPVLSQGFRTLCDALHSLLSPAKAIGLWTADPVATWFEQNQEKILEEGVALEAAIERRELPAEAMLGISGLRALKLKVLFGIPDTQLATYAFFRKGGTSQSRNNYVRRQLRKFDELALAINHEELGPLLDGLASALTTEEARRVFDACRREFLAPVKYHDSVRRLSGRLWAPCDKHCDEYAHRWYGQRRMNSDISKRHRVDSRRRVRSLDRSSAKQESGAVDAVETIAENIHEALGSEQRIALARILAERYLTLKAPDPQRGERIAESAPRKPSRD